MSFLFSPFPKIQTLRSRYIFTISSAKKQYSLPLSVFTALLCSFISDFLFSHALILWAFLSYTCVETILHRTLAFLKILWAEALTAFWF